MIAVIDGSGVYGAMLHYATVIFLVGSALIIFVYLWSKGRLNMDEGPKFEMMQPDNDGENDDDQ